MVAVPLSEKQQRPRICQLFQRELTCKPMNIHQPLSAINYSSLRSFGCLWQRAEGYLAACKTRKASSTLCFNCDSDSKRMSSSLLSISSIMPVIFPASSG